MVVGLAVSQGFLDSFGIASGSFERTVFVLRTADTGRPRRMGTIFSGIIGMALVTGFGGEREVMRSRNSSLEDEDGCKLKDMGFCEAAA